MTIFYVSRAPTMALMQKKKTKIVSYCDCLMLNNSLQTRRDFSFTRLQLTRFPHLAISLWQNGFRSSLRLVADASVRSARNSTVNVFTTEREK